MSSKLGSLTLRKQMLRNKAQLLERVLLGMTETNEDAPWGIPVHHLVW